MTYVELVSEKEKILKAKNLNPNAIFQFLYSLDDRINDLLSFSNYINDEVPQQIIEKVDEYMDLYVNRKMPLAYITKSCFFYGRRFHVDENVLCPRNETEQWLDAVLDVIKVERPLSVLDLCCGSGVIGLTVKAEFPYTRVVLSDISELALRNTIKNAKLHKLDVKVIQSDLFRNIDEKFDMILCNPPYIDYDYPLDESVLKYEPYNAIYSPNRGLLYYELILSEIHKCLNNRYFIALEIGFDLADDVVNLVRKHLGVEPKVIKDFNNHNRVVIVNRL